MTGELVFDDVHVRYGRGPAAVAGVDLVVAPGSVVGLVGESGSGKSTLAKAAVGLAPLSGGRIRLDGQDALRLPGRRRPIQMVFQDPQAALDPRLTVGAAIGEGMHGASRSERRARAGELLELVQLDPDLAGRRPADLSGGQRQRVSLARALAVRPEVLIADEITSALDVSVQGAVLNVLREVQRELGFSVLFISHNLAVVRYVSDVVAVMQGGRLVEAGPVDEIVDRPRHGYTQQLLAAAPTLGQPFLDEPVTS